jgi:hypothetical protein
MPIPEALLQQMKCCLSGDGHIVNEPILLKCGANACKKCANDITNVLFQCYGCYYKHPKKDLLNAANNKIVETLINSSLNDLFQYLEANIESLKGILVFFNFLVSFNKYFMF